MKKMLKRFGYTNIALLIFGALIIGIYVDFDNLKTFDYLLMSLFGITIFIHIIRLVMIAMSKDGR